MSGNKTTYSWQHNAAAARHGWALHAHHEGAEIQLTEEQYLEALDMAAVAKTSKPALSKHLKLED